MFLSIKNVGIKFTQVITTKLQRSGAIPHFYMQFGKYFSPICANCRNTTIPARQRQKMPRLVIQIVSFHFIIWNECIFWVNENPLSVTISAERKRWHSWRLVSTILNVFTLPLTPNPISPTQITGNELDMNIAVSAEVNLVEFDKQTESPQTDKQTEHPLTVEISLYFFTFKTLDVWSDGKAVAPVIDRRWFILIDNGHQYLRRTKTVFPIRNVRMVWRKHLLL